MAIRKKVCLLGAPGVGKTSLVRQFVSQTFSDEYLTTLGVKIERKIVDVDGTALTLMVWDVHGEEGSLVINPTFLKGAAGFLLVIDGTRPETSSSVVELTQRLADREDSSSIVVATNKADLVDDWSAIDASMAGHVSPDAVVRTSAMSGQGVEAAFGLLASSILVGSK